MSDPADSVTVEDDREEGRFVLRQDGAVAELFYDDTEPGRLILIHTGVPDALGGRGIGGRLVRVAVERAVAEHRTVVPWCPFARKWLADHPDVAATVPIDWSLPDPTDGG